MGVITYQPDRTSSPDECGICNFEILKCIYAFYPEVVKSNLFTELNDFISNKKTKQMIAFAVTGVGKEIGRTNKRNERPARESRGNVTVTTRTR